ncbi:MAG: hypothetical protein K2R98_27960 [Gemmataceae bacterium]|nr:hypothetical protein [Gemmataceae bacterium]
MLHKRSLFLAGAVSCLLQSSTVASAQVRGAINPAVQPGPNVQINGYPPGVSNTQIYGYNGLAGRPYQYPSPNYGQGMQGNPWGFNGQNPGYFQSGFGNSGFGSPWNALSSGLFGMGFPGYGLGGGLFSGMNGLGSATPNPALLSAFGLSGFGGFGGPNSGAWQLTPQDQRSAYDYGTKLLYDSNGPPTVAKTALMGAPAPATSDGSAKLSISAPPDADVWIDGEKLSSSDSETRVHTLPSIRGIQSLSVKASWDEDGKPRNVSQQVTLLPGQHKSITFIGAPSAYKRHSESGASPR